MSDGNQDSFKIISKMNCTGLGMEEEILYCLVT